MDVNPSEYDYVVVGAGLSGSVVSRVLADSGKRILIVEKRNHIGGNLYDYIDDGVIVQKYGPHTFHTNNDEVVSFIKRFSDFKDYHLKCEVFIDGITTPSPFNFKTIDQFYEKEEAKELKTKLISKYPKGRATIVDLLKDPDEAIANFARFLFEKDYSLYTSKQWGIPPSKVDVSVLERVPVEFSYKDWYFYDKFEGIPVKGFTSFVSNILKHEKIDFVAGVDALDYLRIEGDVVYFDGAPANVVFTGEVDRLFAYRFGKLPYRSLSFVFEKQPSNYQSAAIVAYPSHLYKYTRITDYSKLPLQESDFTIIAKEYPAPYTEGNEPYYPVLTNESKEQFQKYKKAADRVKNLYLVGRLAEFKYYNMDQATISALNLAERILQEGRNE